MENLPPKSKILLDNWIMEIAAGTSSKTEKEIDEIGSQLNSFLRKTVEGNELSFREKWEVIGSSAQSSDMLHSLSLRIEPDLFFQFGSLLLSDYKGNKSSSQSDSLVHFYLNFFRQSSFLKNIYDQKIWEELVYQLILKSNFHIGYLFNQRLEEYPRKTLFNVVKANTVKSYSWQTVSEKIKELKNGIAALAYSSNGPHAKIAFLMENSLRMATLDLACLTSGIINVMIAANSVPEHIEFILNQSKAEILLVSNDKQLAKIKSIKHKLNHLRIVVLMDGSSIEEWVITQSEMISLGQQLDAKKVAELEGSVNIESLATIMYTSGTTGDPKGIMFSHMNLVYKRFCRAMALPEIGDSDRYLSFLPLFHTFGRFLEMLGAVFWGAEYAFMENPAMETMLDNMKRIQPSIFISIPKKWYELYNHVSSKVDIEFDEPEKILNAVNAASGGNLKWGLSAAGFLEPDVFRFFQRNGIELMSGFGMTEATGGITMTPVGKYKENSLGKPLPGIEVKLGDDGEMLIRGPYVMMDYYDGKDDIKADLKRWLPTGDIMTLDDDGFYTIIDRKKEIYKNIKGETIAPQKIENFFRDFEFVKQVFLVGDHQQFNTVLIFPDIEKKEFVAMDDEQKQNYFSTVVVTVNKFLASFERIVDFRLIDRPFAEKEGELTPKGTYKRRVIEKNFDSVIKTMYTKNYIDLSWKDQDIRIPNWFLREKGCLTHDILIEEDNLIIPKYNQSLSLKSVDHDKSQIIIGNFIFDNYIKFVDFQIILNNPLYWLGDYDIVNFTGDSIYQWYRLDTTDKRMHFNSIVSHQEVEQETIEKFTSIADGEEYSLQGLHFAVLLFQSGDLELQQQAIDYFKFILEDDSLPLFNLAKDIVSRPKLCLSTKARRLLFNIGLPYFKAEEFQKYLHDYLSVDWALLDEETILHVIKDAKGDENLEAIYKILKTEIKELVDNKLPDNSFIPSLFDLLAEYGIHHPTRYKRVRQLIVRYQLTYQIPALVKTAHKARLKMLDGFRRWLGLNQPVAVDVETGEEYEWSEVITFEEDIVAEDRDSILSGISESSIVREAIFLLSSGSMVRLYDIPPGGIWVSLIEEKENETFYRLSVQTRYQGAYDLVLCLNKKYMHEELRDEINWLIHISTVKSGENLVDNFGGYWQAYKLWTKEYIPSNSIEKFMQRVYRKSSPENNKRLYFLWPFFIWSAAWAHIQFWRRTNFTMELADKTIGNIVIPSHDYQMGIKHISIQKRVKSTNLKALLNDFHQQFVVQGEASHEVLKQGSVWHYIFSAVLNSEGEERGFELIDEIIKTGSDKEEITREAKEYKNNYKRNGYLPKRLFFAIRRFERWSLINKDAALSAQARTLNELYDTYQLSKIEKKYPETRPNFFLNTVFADSSEAFRKALFNIVQKQHNEYYSADESIVLISHLQKDFELTEKETFFLARLSYPHLKPEDTAEFISLHGEGEQHADVVIQLEDYDGLPYLLRKPVSPKEISKLHQIFMDAQMPVSFRPEHQFLVSISERGHIIGGLFYSYIDHQTVYMEKIVVSNRYRRKGISEGIMQEFFNRMRSEHIETVTTGFFRPEYFYRFGFKVERKYSGLAKDLNKD
ncbi:MAG: GNAT family N-acetyltransferase [Calditrichaeota bacterium]|nr:MAG: GNAT family N-acetyltransferase [Calditrichota bacterium]MBL1206276.1 GNAT family N-acetyltransferase [Calditrichota bacterium]NOG46102.1 GNAT family N-acetyltransferase [Calditrichota bacterium]